LPILINQEDNSVTRVWCSIWL